MKEVQQLKKEMESNQKILDANKAKEESTQMYFLIGVAVISFILFFIYYFFKKSKK